MGAARQQPILDKAMALHRSGDLGGAAKLYQQLIEADPQCADAYQLLGVVAQQMGRTALAQDLLHTAITINPRHAPALTNLALIIRAAGDLPTAYSHASAAVAADPTYPEAHIALGGVLAAQRDYKTALQHYDIARQQQPNNTALLNDIATAARRTGEWELAHSTIEQAIALQLRNAILHNTHGNLLRAAGQPNLAITAFNRAMACDPDLLEARHNAALAHLLVGDFATGWRLYASRGQPEPRYADLMRWDGKSNVPLLLRAEQGLGDTLQCVRYVTATQQLATRFVLEVQPPLQEFLQHNFPDITIITPHNALPPDLTHEVRMLDLPPLGLPESPAPYLTAPPSQSSSGLNHLPRTAPRFGLVWGGNPAHLNDANRSVPLGLLAPALAPYQTHGVSLQKGAPVTELAKSGLTIFDASPYLTDFAATAAVVQQLDVVISVDTAVAHLAAALGKPVWLLLPFDPDWRWLLNRRDTPLYPTMTLLRQHQPQDWSSPLAELATMLTEFIAGRRKPCV